MAKHLSFQTDLGRVGLAWTEAGISALRFLQGPAEEDAAAQAPMWVLEAVRRLMAHLNGTPQDLASIPVDLSGCTAFQRTVSEVLRATLPGDRLSYGEVALRAGRPGAARAVGQAVKRNPLLLLVPCHRVVAAEGEGGWSAFGTPDVKVRLRQLESPSGG